MGQARALAYPRVFAGTTPRGMRICQRLLLAFLLTASPPALCQNPAPRTEPAAPPPSVSVPVEPTSPAAQPQPATPSPAAQAPPTPRAGVPSSETLPLPIIGTGQLPRDLSPWSMFMSADILVQSV